MRACQQQPVLGLVALELHIQLAARVLEAVACELWTQSEQVKMTTSAKNVSDMKCKHTLINDDVRPWHAAEAGGIILAHQELVGRQHYIKLRLPDRQHLRHRHRSCQME